MAKDSENSRKLSSHVGRAVAMGLFGKAFRVFRTVDMIAGLATSPQAKSAAKKAAGRFMGSNNQR